MAFGIYNASTLTRGYNETDSFHYPFFSQIAIANSGSLTQAVGYAGVAGNPNKQVVATAQTDAEIATITYTIDGAGDRTTFEFITGERFTTPDPVTWYPSVSRTITAVTGPPVAYEVTDTNLVGVDVAKLHVLMLTSTGASVQFAKITTGSPTIAQVLFNSTTGKLSFHADNNGKGIIYTYPKVDSANNLAIGLPGAARNPIDYFQSVFTLGVGNGYVRGIIPRAKVSTEYNLSGGEKSTFTKTATALLAPSYSKAVCYQWLSNITGAEI